MPAEADFWLFDQRKQRELFVAPMVRRRVLRELAHGLGRGSAAELLAAAPAVRVLGEELVLGRRVVSVVSEASPHLSFSQHIGSQGRMGAALSCSFNNALRRLDTLSLELKSYYGEGTTYEASWLFPFSALPGHSLALSARRGRETLAEGLRAEQHGASLALRSRGAQEGEFEVGVSTRRLEMDPADFPRRQTACCRQSATALALKYGRRVLGQPGGDRNARLGVEALLFRERPPDFKTRMTLDWKTSLGHALRFCSLRQLASLGLHFSLPGGPGISRQYANSFPALRGFAAVEANVPFPRIEETPRAPTWDCSLAHSLQLQCDDFAPLGHGGLLPFFHTTNYARLGPAGALRLHSVLGVGFALQLHPSVRVEALYNFAHFNASASRFNREEGFQLRVSSTD